MTSCRSSLPRACLSLVLAALWLAPVQAAPHAHQHGVAKLAVAVDGNTLTIDLDAPLDGFLGFERAPRNDAERKAAADLLARLRDAAGLFKPDAAAGCKAAEVTIDAPSARARCPGQGRTRRPGSPVQLPVRAAAGLAHAGRGPVRRFQAPAAHRRAGGGCQGPGQGHAAPAGARGPPGPLSRGSAGRIRASCRGDARPCPQLPFRPGLGLVRCACGQVPRRQPGRRAGP
jgi:hypothetical protein